MRLPDFLIIGAMKSGTTSLYFDLRSNPAVFLPEDKEPTCLAEDAVLEEQGRASYARLFRSARSDQLCGEASTGYSKLPEVRGVPARALALLGSRVKIIYLVREPVARTLSHHYHEVTAGTMQRDVDLAVRRHSRLIDFSRYAMQLEPWLDLFEPGQIQVIRFEDYVQDRPGSLTRICDFLEVPSDTMGVEQDKVHNRGEDARVPTGWMWRFSRGSFYRSWIRPWVSRPIRTRIRKLFMPPAGERPGPPSLATVDLILDGVRTDQEKLQRMLEADEPLWDLDDVRARYSGRSG